MADPKYPLYDDARNPFATEGLRRRAAREEAAAVAPEIERDDAYKGNWLAETARSIGVSAGNDLTNGLEYLGRGLVGDTEGRQRAAEAYLAEQERARRLGPEIQTLDDAKAAGGGVGDYLAYGAYELAKMAPDIVMTGTGMGVGGVLGRRAARRSIQRGLASQIEARAANVAGRIEDVRLARAQARQLAAAAPGGPEAVSSAVRVAQAQVEERARKEAMKEAARISGRTARGDLTAGEASARVFAQDQIGRVGRRAGVVGGTLASIPSLNGAENAEQAADPNTSVGDMWALAAGTTAAAATQVVPLERFIGRFGNEARAEVAKKAERFLPRVVKESLKQGAVEGSQEVVQQALQNASHAWVAEDPNRLWGPDAAKQYLASFLVGGTMGAAMGGAGEGARATADVAGKAAASGFRTTRDYVKAKIQEYGDKAREMRAKNRAGQPMDVEDGDAPPTAADWFKKAKAAAESLGNTTVAAGKSASDKFKSYFDDIDTDEQADALMKDIEARHARYEATGVPEGPELQRLTSPVRMENKFQDILMRAISPDSDIWQVPEAAQHVGKVLERLARGSATDADERIIGALVDSASSGLDRNTVHLIRSAGPELTRRHDATLAANKKADSEDALDQELERVLAKRASGKKPTKRDIEVLRAANRGKLYDLAPAENIAAPDDAPLNTQMRDALAAAMPERSSPNDAEGEAKVSPPALDVHQGGDADPIDVLEGLRASKRPEDAARHNELKAELREKILGSSSTSWVRSKARAKQFDEKLASPEYVEAVALRPINVAVRSDKGHTFINSEGQLAKKGEQAHERQLISLAGIANRQMSKLGSDQFVGEDGNIRGAEALLAGLSELKTLGIELKPDTFTPGEIRMSPKGDGTPGAFIATIVDGNRPTNLARNQIHIDALRGAAGLMPTRVGAAKIKADRAKREVNASQDNAHVLRKLGNSARKRINARVRNGSLPKSDFDENGDRIELSATDEESRRNAFVEAKRDERKDGGELSNDEQFKQGPRKRPDGYQVPKNKQERGEFISSEDPVSAVRAENPYAEIVQRALKAFEKNPNAKFEAGVEIGKMELQKALDAGMSAPRYAKALRRLEDVESGEAARYWNKAYNKGRGSTFGEQVSVSNRGAAKEDKAVGRDERFDSGDEVVMPPVDVLRQRQQTRAQEIKAEEALALPSKARKRVAKKTAKKEGGTFDDRDDIAQSADAKAGEHDHTKESKLATAMMKALGFARKITVVAHDNLMGGRYWAGSGKLELGAGLTGAERIEVLSHELGHAVIVEHIAKLTGLDQHQLVDADGGALRGDAWMDKLKEVDPELHAALEKDYLAWLGNADITQKDTQLRASRAPLHRATGILSRNNGTPFRKTSAEHKAYTLSFNEWTADHIARALTQDARGQGILEKFFAGIADALRKAYDALFGTAEAKKWAPAPSVEAWVKSLFDANVAAVKAGTATPAAPKKAAPKKAAPKKAAPKKVAPKAPGATVSKKRAKKIVKAAAAAQAPAGSVRGPQTINDMREFVRSVLKPEERLILERVFRRAPAVDTIRSYLVETFPGTENMIDDAKTGMETLIAAGYFAWRDGKFNGGGPNGRKAFIDIRDQMVSIFGASGEGDLAQRVLEDIANGTVQRFHDKNKTYSVRELEARAHGTSQRVFNWLAQKGPVSDALSTFWSGIYSRMHDAGIPAMRELAAMLQRQQGQTGDEDRGLIPAVRTMTLQWHRRYEGIVKDLTPAQRERMLTVLQRGVGKGDPVYDVRNKKVRDAVDAMRALFKDFYDYDDASIDLTAKKRPGYREGYFPVVVNINHPDARAELTALYSQEHFKEALFAQFDIPQKDRNDKTFQRLVKRAVDAAAEPASFDPSAKPAGKANIGAASQKRRFSAFVYDASVRDGKGNVVISDPRTPAQRRADLRTFAKLQSKNVDEIFARYFNARVKVAEFQRRFGTVDGKGGWNSRGKLDALIAEIKRQGGDDADVKLAENAVKAALGTYGLDISPTLDAISPALAKKFSGPKTKAFIQGGQAYQNLRLLPLALISSMVDPMGIAVRTGGDFGSSWEGFRTGMRTLFNKKEAQRLHDELLELGLADDFMPAIASHPTFDQKDNSFARKVNEAVFKWNGMNAWIQATRVMAAHAGHKFLLRHAEGAAAGDATSKRYLAELSVEPGDIVDDGKGRVVINDKTRAALQQFVDEAILRPNALQSPLWHRDPYMGLVSQYKAFAYAIYDQITTRMAREVNHGNYRVLLAAMAYLPIALMAELLREFLQYGTDGNPNRKDWGPAEYTAYATERTGLLGPRADILGDIKGDLSRNELPGTSQLGPTGGQAENALDAFTGRRDLGKEFEAALPASAAWRHWNDTPTNEAIAA